MLQHKYGNVSTMRGKDPCQHILLQATTMLEIKTIYLSLHLYGIPIKNLHLLQISFNQSSIIEQVQNGAYSA